MGSSTVTIDGTSYTFKDSLVFSEVTARPTQGSSCNPSDNRHITEVTTRDATGTFAGAEAVSGYPDLIRVWYLTQLNLDNNNTWTVRIPVYYSKSARTYTFNSQAQGPLPINTSVTAKPVLLNGLPFPVGTRAYIRTSNGTPSLCHWIADSPLVEVAFMQQLGGGYLSATLTTN